MNDLIVAICDDDALFRQEIKDFLIQYKKDRRIHLDIVEFSDGQALLNYDRDVDIVFLDYEMPGLDGIETARKMRERKSLCCIIYTSSYPEYVFTSFEVNTYRYFVKPVDFDNLTVALDSYMRERKMFSPIVVNVDGEQLTVNSEDIIYLEAEGKYCRIRTADNTFRSSKTIGKVYELLPQHCFFRTHRSYVINLYCIHSINNEYVVLSNGEKAAISRNNAVALKEAYRNFIKHFIKNPQM